MLWLTPILFLALPVLAVLARKLEASWYGPAAFFGAIWCALAGLPLLFGPIRIVPGGMLFVVAACSAVLAGAWAARLRLAPNTLSRSGTTRLPLVEWLIAACTILSFATVLFLVASIGRGPTGVGGAHRPLQVFLSFQGLATTIHDLSDQRYSGLWPEPTSARLLVSANYLGALLAGLVLGTQTSGRLRWLSLMIFVPAGLITIVLTTKSSMLLPLMLTASSYLASSIAIDRPPSLNLIRASWLLGFAAILLAGFVVVQIFRYGNSSHAQAGAVLVLFWQNLFPYLGVFADWLQSGGWATSHPTLGYYTFAGIFDLLHVHTRVAGLYPVAVTVDGSRYNIYTVFRGLIEDFTLPGALVFLGLGGFGAEAAYIRVREGDLRYAAPLAAFYVFTMWSFVADIFINNTILLAFALLFAYLLIATKPSIVRATTQLDSPWRRLPRTRRHSEAERY